MTTDLVGSALILGIFVWLFVDDIRGNPSRNREPVIRGVNRGHGQTTETDLPRP